MHAGLFTSMFNMIEWHLGYSRPCHSLGFQTRRPRFETGLDHVGFVVGKMALGQVSPVKSSFHQLLHNHLSSVADTIGQ
jgi:hypothetical protein